MDLVILAGGMGSRFGGNKQTAYVDENNSFLLDYSIYNALQSGFDKFVFILNQASYQLVKDKYSKYLSNLAKCEFIIQDDQKILQPKNINRVKPLGTAYALLCVEDVVKDNFCIINADDYYGKHSFSVASKFLKHLDKKSNQFALVGYQLKNTLSENGTVKRGVCTIDNNDNLTKLTESIVEQKDGKIIAKALDNQTEVVADINTLVSMNMFCLSPAVFNLLHKQFNIFTADNQNLTSKEFLLPTELQNLMSKQQLQLKVIPTADVWIGMTYQQDQPFVVAELKKLVDKEEFPTAVYKKFKTAIK